MIKLEMTKNIVIVLVFLSLFIIRIVLVSSFIFNIYFTKLHLKISIVCLFGHLYIIKMFFIQVNLYYKCVFLMFKINLTHLN